MRTSLEEGDLLLEPLPVGLEHLLLLPEPLLLLAGGGVGREEKKGKRSIRKGWHK